MPLTRRSLIDANAINLTRQRAKRNQPTPTTRRALRVATIVFF
jgi:hypothetical protein